VLNAICDPAEERAQLEAIASDVIPLFRKAALSPEGSGM
jgi:hypothetical protein